MDPVLFNGGDALDLKPSCEREPVHVPGLIQPHGVLLVIYANTRLIVQTAGDLEAALGIPDAPQGRSLDDVLGLPFVALWENSVAGMRRDPVYVGTTTGRSDAGALTVTAHLVDGVAVIEFEPAVEAMTAALLLSSMRSITERIGDASTLVEAAAIAAGEIEAITGYDRVMVYQFLPDGSGSVIAETKVENLLTFMNHRFPASDIPAQARELYRRSPIRVIPDVDYVAAPLAPLLFPGAKGPLDMSHCALRSVSPIHIKYLKNMGVGASMSVSLLVRGELWGLIACHNTTAKQVPYEAREMCKHVAQILSQKIQSQAEADEHQLRRDFGSASERLLRDILDADQPDTALLDAGAALEAIVQAGGAVIAWKGALTIFGRTPAIAEVSALADWLRMRVAAGDMLICDKLAEQYPPAAEFEREGSGILSILLTGDDAPLLMWFRAEQVEEISWAGNPHEPLEPGSNLDSLNPRKSFATWQETVRGRSEPWRAVEIDTVRSFARRLSLILQQQHVRELNVLLQHANDQLATLAATDALTGLANRRAFDERLLYEWDRARRRGASVALITLDLDLFKQYNDHFGHPEGDACLKQVAQVLGRQRRSTDLPARVGGEEFSVLLAETDLEGAVLVAEKIRADIESLQLSHPMSPFGIVTASLGLAAQIPAATSVMQELIRAADVALYTAKKGGRNRVITD